VTAPSAHRRSAAVRTLLALLLFQGLSGIAGGAALVAKPSGAVLRMPVSNLRDSPFHDFLVPGLILLLVLGVSPLLTLAGLWARQAWAWYSSFAVGCGLVIFEIVEVSVVGFSFLQIVYGAVGVAIAAVTLLPTVRRYCDVCVLGGS
jgi:hypothetical protein